MPTCFVIQPFDGGTFDKRFEDVFKPAIEAAGLEPYRVDRDPKVTVPIDSIEEGIRAASACLADITTDNPNVWYELGYSFAAARPVVMVCAVAERQGKKFPFDIQHRTIVQYSTDAPRDFDKLKGEVTARLKAFMDKAVVLQRIGESQQIAPVAGLSQVELAVLAATAGSVFSPAESVSAHGVKTDVEQSGFTPVAFALGLRRLMIKGFISSREVEEYQSGPYQVVTVTEQGWEWIDRNEGKFVLQRNAERQPPSKAGDEVPF
jgi:hypothetical protein